MYIFEYKELIKNLVISDLKTKYSNSALGFVWSMLNPLLMMLVLYLVFNNVFRNNQEHFALYILIGLTGWRFFALGTSTAMSSIVGRSSLVTKIYIPREILTISVVLSALVSSLLEFLVLIPPSTHIRRGSFGHNPPVPCSPCPVFPDSVRHRTFACFSLRLLQGH